MVISGLLLVMIVVVCELWCVHALHNGDDAGQCCADHQHVHHLSSASLQYLHYNALRSVPVSRHSTDQWGDSMVKHQPPPPFSSPASDWSPLAAEAWSAEAGLRTMRCLCLGSVLLCRHLWVYGHCWPVWQWCSVLGLAVRAGDTLVHSSTQSTLLSVSHYIPLYPLYSLSIQAQSSDLLLTIEWHSQQWHNLTQPRVIITPQDQVRILFHWHQHQVKPLMASYRK